MSENTADTRTPPHDIHAEQVAVGAALQDSRGDILRQVVEIAGPEAFYRPAHTTILATMQEMADAGADVDPVAVNAELTKRGEIGRTGGAEYLHTLTEAVPSAANGGYYARIVADQYRFRSLVQLGTRLAQLGYTAQGDPDDVYAHARAEFDRSDAALGGAEGDTWVCEIGDLAMPALDRISGDRDHARVPTPYTDLNATLGGGLKPGQLVVVGGKTGTGKSTLALDIARAAAKRDQRTLMINLEMEPEELAIKVISAESRVPMDALNDHTRLDDDQWQRIPDAVAQMKAMPITVDSYPATAVARIRGRLAHQHRIGAPVDMLVVDYLQLVQTPDAHHERREREVAALSRDLKLLAKEFHIPVIAMAQLNREADKRDGRPRVADIRESGAVAQDADIVILLHQADEDDPHGERAGETDLVVAKNRNGPKRDVAVLAQLHYSRFVNMARD